MIEFLILSMAIIVAGIAGIGIGIAVQCIRLMHYDSKRKERFIARQHQGNSRKGS